MYAFSVIRLHQTLPMILYGKVTVFGKELRYWGQQRAHNLVVDDDGDGGSVVPLLFFSLDKLESITGNKANQDQQTDPAVLAEQSNKFNENKGCCVTIMNESVQEWGWRWSSNFFL